MASGEVSWDDETDVKEIIADVRDVECDMAWCVLLPLYVHVDLVCQRAPTREASRDTRRGMKRTLLLISWEAFLPTFTRIAQQYAGSCRAVTVARSAVLHERFCGMPAEFCSRKLTCRLVQGALWIRTAGHQEAHGAGSGRR